MKDEQVFKYSSIAVYVQRACKDEYYFTHVTHDWLRALYVWV